MAKVTRFVGLDVHADTVAVAVADGRRQVRSLGTVENRAEAVARVLRKLGKPNELRFATSLGASTSTTLQPRRSASASRPSSSAAATSAGPLALRLQQVSPPNIVGWAGQTIPRCTWAKAFYQTSTQSGGRLRRIHCDESRYLAALGKRSAVHFRA
jgi:hypothetical protein